MKCPYCGYSESKVTDSREIDNAVRRRRECLRCGIRFTTYERIQAAALYVIKRDGRREEFNREKITAGVRKACVKRSLPIGAIEKLVDDIEAHLIKLGKAEVPASLIGEMVMERLRTLDRVAYIRFASVYRDFQDIQSFRQEADALLQGAEPVGQLPLLPGPPPVQRRGRPRRGGVPIKTSPLSPVGPPAPLSKHQEVLR